MIRKLHALPNFKANEVKFLLLYLAPIIFPPYLFGENRKSDEVDLKKLVFSIRELFESSRNADFCHQLLCEFCVSMAEKTNKMDTINFHLLRHLGWQTKSIGPLYTASAAMFESANWLLIAPLTGTVNQCQLMVWRFIRAKMLIKMTFREDYLTPMLADFLEKKEVRRNVRLCRKFRHQNILEATAAIKTLLSFFWRVLFLLDCVRTRISRR